MDKPRRQAMDIMTPRVAAQTVRGRRLSRRQLLASILVVLILVVLLAATHWYQHRNDQRILADHYQVVYLVTGQIYFGKLQNTAGQYLTLTSAYTLQNSTTTSSSSAGSLSEPSKLLKVSQQVYGPDDSMAIRADQVQFWQNLRSDSKVVRAITSGPGQQ